ncbi:MAG: LPXTG cell wall anchor domain-containing protein [Faecousia sp.]
MEVDDDMGNDFQENIGFVDWEFKVEEIPHDPNAPKTGDTSHIYLLVTVMVVSLVAIILLVGFYFKKKRKNRK